MKQIGIYGLAIPEEYGGSPGSMPCFVLVAQELSRGWMSLAGAMGGHTVVAKLLTLFGTEEQKKTYLPAMATGEVRATVSRYLPKLGYKGVESCELSFDGYRVAGSAILGGVPGKGFAQMMKGLETGRIQVAARALGGATAPPED